MDQKFITDGSVQLLLNAKFLILGSVVGSDDLSLDQNFKTEESVIGTQDLLLDPNKSSVALGRTSAGSVCCFFLAWGMVLVTIYLRWYLSIFFLLILDVMAKIIFFSSK